MGRLISCAGRSLKLIPGSVANEQEHRRFDVNAVIGEKALREVYLRPFEILIKSETPPACLMTAYNCVNGQHVDMNNHLLNDVLRREWGFSGLVMSDWGGTNSIIESLVAGCDLEMPGPSLRRGQKLSAALELDESSALKNALDLSSTRILELAERLGKLNLSPEEVRASRHMPERSLTSQRDCTTLRRAAATGMVLLKNDHQRLPLDPAALHGKRVAFLGPYALVGASNGGGSAAMNPQYLSHPVDSFKTALADMGIKAEVNVASGCLSHKWLPLLQVAQWSAPGKSETLVRIDFYASIDCTGDIVETQYRNNSSVDLFDSGPESLRDGGEPYSFRLTSQLTPNTTGRHSFGISSVGGARLLVDGRLLLENNVWEGVGETFYSFGSPEKIATMEMEAGKQYQVIVEARSKDKHQQDATSSESETDPMHCYGAQPSTRLGFLEEDRENIKGAVKLADSSDLAIVVVGLGEEWESEGYDRKSMKLPGKQIELVQTLLDNTRHPENIIIVNQSGSPVEMPWADRASTILQAWYGGQEAGNALADVLLGIASPEGRLPMSWPRAYEDLPFAKDEETWPGVDDVVLYKEGSYVGYRWFLDAGTNPHWWFGFGLGYTTFSSSIEQIEVRGEVWRASVKSKNTGLRSGSDVVQIYAWPTETPAAKTLVAFEKLDQVEPNSERSVELDIRMRDCASWTDDRWELQARSYTFGIGKHAGDLEIHTAVVQIDATKFWSP